MTEAHQTIASLPTGVVIDRARELRPSGRPWLRGDLMEVAMAEVVARALTPEEIGKRAALIARSLEGLQVSDARTILGFAGGYLPRPPDEGMVVRFPAIGGEEGWSVVDPLRDEVFGSAAGSLGKRQRDGSGNVVGIDGET